MGDEGGGWEMGMGMRREMGDEGWGWEMGMEIDDDMDVTVYSSRSASRAIRSFALPDNADRDNIEANMDEGVLTVHIPKTSTEKESVKQIEIK